jgi:hypothetical protein
MADDTTKMFNHVLDNMIMLDQKASVPNLARRMTVTNMPRQFQQVSSCDLR